MFADDLKIMWVIQSPADIVSLQSDLERLSKWCTSNRMELNLKKSYRMTANSFVAIAALALMAVLPTFAKVTQDPQQDKCRSLSSCSSCITNSYCVWCVTKSICTKQECGNDNIIYPNDIAAIMSGPDFCPRVVSLLERNTFKSGKKETLVVKITQIHLYMAFTPWKCQIVFGGKERVVNAVLLGDTVFCEAQLFTNESNEPSVSGSVSVLWDYSKHFDGSIPFKVCRCDLDPKCIACSD